MNEILAEILLLTGVFNFVLILSTSPFIEEADRKPALIAWMLSFAIYASSSIYLGLLYFSNPDLFEPISSASIVGFFMLVSGYTGSVFFFRPMIKGDAGIKIIRIGITILAINALGTYCLTQLPKELRFIGPAIWTIVLSGWFFYELNRLLKNKNDYLIFVLKTLTAIVFLPSLIWLAMVANFYWQISPSMSEDLLNLLGFAIRIIRNLVAPISFLIIFIYWIRYHSAFSIRSKNSQQEIKKLLEEKDHLILEMSNINSLVSTGALAAGLAHELNQYLARIQINAEEALDHEASNTKDSKVIDPLHRILGANSEASKLILSLRNLLRTKDEGNQLTEVSIIIRNVRYLYVPRAMQSKIDIVFDANELNGQVRWGSLLTQVLSNLISNAIEALDSVDHQLKKIIISYECIEGMLFIKVYDNGPSIHPAKIDSMFRLFTTTKKEGTGIGLWLSKFIVQRFGGDLYFENIPNGGVTFIIKVPNES